MNSFGRLVFAQCMTLLFLLQQSVLPAALAVKPVVDEQAGSAVSGTPENVDPTQELQDAQKIDIDPIPELKDDKTGSTVFQGKKQRLDQRVDTPEQTIPGTESAKSTGTELAPHFSPTDANFIRRYLKETDYIPVSEIKAGMEGYGLTVFHGTKVEKFNVVVIGIIRKALNGRDAILIRISGDKLGKNNVVRGMSGSPIYLNGRLCGALSYGFDFSREPIVGVTPVVDMLDALTFHDEIMHRRNVSLLHKPAYIDAPASSLVMPNTVPVAGGSMRMTPLLAPVSLSGFSPRAQAFLKDKFEDVGLAVASGSTGALDPALVSKMSAAAEHAAVAGGEDGDPRKVSPGSAVAVMLTTGAFASAATGTTTAVFGNKVVAFGHSFMEGGSISLPMATAYILEILPSLSVSFKLSSPLQIVGSIFADRPWSIGAELGRYATMVPLDITVSDEGRGVQKVFRCKVVNHPQLTPDLISASIMSALDSTYQSQTPYVVKVASRITVRDHGVIKRMDRFPVNFAAHVASHDSLLRSRPPGDPLSGFIGGIVDRLVSNDFERAQVTGVTVDVTIEDGRRVTSIDRISLDKSVVAPGEDVTLNCLMKPYNGKPYNKPVVFHIPRDVPDGDLAIAACGGDELDAVRRRMGLSDPPSETLNQIIRRVERKERGDTLCGVLALPQQSIALHGMMLKSPPAHWSRLFFTDRSTKTPYLVRSEQSFHETGDNIVDGSHIIAVTVRRPDKISSKALPMPLSGTTNHPTDGIYITEQARKALDSGKKADSTAAASTSSAQSTTAGSGTAAASDSNKLPPLWSVANAFPHIRGIQLWRQDAEEDFRGAKLDGVLIDNWGRLSPGYREIARVHPPIEEDQKIWDGVYLNGFFYYSSGNKVFRWAGSEAIPELVASCDGLIIPTLAVDAERNLLYFAGAPGSKIYALNVAPTGSSSATTPSSSASSGNNAGEARIVAQLPTGENTITSLAVAADGCLYIGTAGSGKLYRKAPNSPTALVFDSGQAHISALWYCRRENRLYVGTAEKGSVYSIACGPSSSSSSSNSSSSSGPTSGPNVRAEYESDEHIVTGVVKSKAGNLFVATAGSGKLIRIEPKGEAEEVALSEAFYRLHYDDSADIVYAGDGEGDVTRVEIEAPSFGNQAHFLPVSHTEQEGVMALATDGQGHLFCGTANVAQLRCLEIAPSATPSFSSLVHDAGKPAVWSRLRLANAFNQEKSDFARFITVESRGGETSQPDLSWSPWVVAPPDAGGHDDGFDIKTPACRFLQYRLVWRSLPPSKDNRDLLVSRVDVTYLPNNSAPSITSVSVKTNEALAGKVPISVSGSDPDADNMLLTVELSSDSGKSWQTVAADVRSRTVEKDKVVKASKEKIKSKESELKQGEKNKTGAVKGEVKSAETRASESAADIGSAKTPKAPPAKPENPDSSKKRLQDNDAQPSSEDKQDDEDRKSNPSAGDKPRESEKSKEPEKSKSADKTKENDKDKKDEKADKSTGGSSSSSSTTSASAGGKSSETFSQTEKFTYNFDSKKEKDGDYLLRMTLSDRPSNARDAQTAVAFRAIVIDNGEPVIDALEFKKTGEGLLSVHLTAHDASSSISDCVCKIDDGEGFALSTPSGGGQLSDSSKAVFAGDMHFDSRAKKLTVQVFDRAGNSAKKTVSLP